MLTVIALLVCTAMLLDCLQTTFMMNEKYHVLVHCALESIVVKLNADVKHFLLQRQFYRSISCLRLKSVLLQVWQWEDLSLRNKSESLTFLEIEMPQIERLIVRYSLCGLNLERTTDP